MVEEMKRKTYRAFVLFMNRNYIKAQISRNSYKLPNTTSMDKAKLCVRWWRCWWEKQSITTCTEKTGSYSFLTFSTSSLRHAQLRTCSPIHIGGAMQSKVCETHTKWSLPFLHSIRFWSRDGAVGKPFIGLKLFSKLFRDRRRADA